MQLIVYQVAEALAFMHGKKFTHRDIKPSNVFVVTTSPTYWVKLGDFGVSKRVKNDSTPMSTTIYTDYTAPEIMGFIEVEDEASSYTSAVDLWSLGCLCYWLLTKSLPLALNQMFRYCKGRIVLPIAPLLEFQASNACVDFLRLLLRPHPDERPTSQQVLGHGWPTEPTFNSRDSDDERASMPMLASNATIAPAKQPTASSQQQPSNASLQTPHDVVADRLRAASLESPSPITHRPRSPSPYAQARSTNSSTDSSGGILVPNTPPKARYNSTSEGHGPDETRAGMGIVAIQSCEGVPSTPSPHGPGDGLLSSSKHNSSK